MAGFVLMAGIAIAPLVVRAAADAAEGMGALPASRIPKYIVEAVNSPDRPAADRELDKSRRPEQLMAFFGIKPGMKVADVSAAGGYTTELLARIVGPSGKVYSQNNPGLLERFKKVKETWDKRLKEPGLSNVVAVVKPLDSPDLFPVEPGTLDAVIIDLNYHDFVWMGVNRTKLNESVFKALKSGGVYGTVDNSAAAGSGDRDAHTLHRIDQAFETKEIEQAGFKLVATSDIFRNPKDTRTVPSGKMNHTQDRFVLKFVKP
jgi:predicted methyltransferase